MEKIENIAINTEKIQLDQFLKWAGITESGGQVKVFISEEMIYVNGILETAKRKQLYPGDIVEIKEKKEKYSEPLYFKDKMLHVKVKKYCVKQRIQKNFYKVYNNCIIDSIEWIEKVPHLRIITQNDRVKCINMLFIEDIVDSE